MRAQCRFSSKISNSFWFRHRNHKLCIVVGLIRRTASPSGKMPWRRLPGLAKNNLCSGGQQIRDGAHTRPVALAAHCSTGAFDKWRTVNVQPAFAVIFQQSATENPRRCLPQRDTPRCRCCSVPQSTAAGYGETPPARQTPERFTFLRRAGQQAPFPPAYRQN